MTIRGLKGQVEENIPIRNVLLSVSDKSGLDFLVGQLVDINPEIRLISTGGTYKKVKERLGVDAGDNLLEVAEYTGFPEMEGGLVKTLHPKIHAGLLGERNNPAHQEYLEEMNGDYIDLIVVNLYPFQDVVRKIEAGETDPKTSKPYNFESARGNIDIGGPTMIRAVAKNFPSCAVICDPKDYMNFIKTVRDNEGCTNFDQRLDLAVKVFSATAGYDRAIADYFEGPGSDVSKVRSLYEFSGGDK